MSLRQAYKTSEIENNNVYLIRLEGFFKICYRVKPSALDGVLKETDSDA